MIQIRPYTAGDRDAIRALHLVALQQVEADAGPGPWDDDLDHIEEEYLRAGGEFLVGEIDGSVVAMGALRKVNRRCAEIKRMRVHPAAQRRGFGQLILEHLESAARHRGFTRLVLDTTTQQVGAQSLYRKNGFRETRREYDGRFEMVFTEKQISEPSLPADAEDGAAEG